VVAEKNTNKQMYTVSPKKVVTKLMVITLSILSGFLKFSQLWCEVLYGFC